MSNDDMISTLSVMHKFASGEDKEALGKALDILDSFSGWIPVNEKLPRLNDLVIISTDSPYDIMKVTWAVYGGDPVYDHIWSDGTVKAWMPMPKPYKEED